MKILYYDWGSNSNEDIYQALTRFGIVYDIWNHPINNYERDIEFKQD